VPESVTYLLLFGDNPPAPLTLRALKIILPANSIIAGIMIRVRLLDIGNAGSTAR